MSSITSSKTIVFEYARKAPPTPIIVKALAKPPKQYPLPPEPLLSRLKQTLLLKNEEGLHKIIGSGSFGSVWSLRTRSREPCVLKLSPLKEDLKRESYEREIHFLQLPELRDSALVPKLVAHEVIEGYGCQLIERCDCSLRDLGTQQSRLYRLPRQTMAFTEKQLQGPIALATALDNKRIVHGDLKPANIMIKGLNNASSSVLEMKLIDFGFAGYHVPGTSYAPTIGFLRHYGFPFQTKRDSMGRRELVKPIPESLLPYFNRLTLLVILCASSPVYLIPGKRRLLTKDKFRRLSMIPQRVFKEFRLICNQW